MSNYKELLQTAREFLKDNGIADADLDAWYLLAHVFGINRAGFFMYGNEEASMDKALLYKELIKKRALHIPLQYLTGTQEFMGLEFDVDENVLIPRQDTELLVEEVLKVCNNKSVLDVCTGSGCIIISLSKLGNLKKAIGTDISQKALQIANRNAKKLNADVNFIQGDLFERVVGNYDIIVSNPPYIRNEELKSLMPEVKDHEPKQALDGGPDGLIFYERIINDLHRYLNPGGYVYFEIGYDQGEAVKEMLYEAGLVDIIIKKDFNELDRIVYARKSF
ncbi:MAG: peptide chain release factor N(5)-glutamine methyltransferase [Anaerolineaceae bacterium]|nr:MAG: peptide chain release factor N(5)-glutamine methyltransferase [Anaerolineaceae bacterium]